MKYVPHADFSLATSALNFRADDWTLNGTCDLFTIKASGDKKLYKRVCKALQKSDQDLVRKSQATYPNESEKQEKWLLWERATPLGKLNEPATRKLCAYFLAAINSAHPDHDVSEYPNPWDFSAETLGKARNTIDDLIYGMRPKYAKAEYVAPIDGSGPWTPRGSNLWNPRIWQKIDNEMDLINCDVFRYKPNDDQLDRGAFPTKHYLFYNEEKRRVCYIYLRQNFRPRPPRPKTIKRRHPGPCKEEEDRAKRYNPYAKPNYSSDEEYLSDEEAWDQQDAFYASLGYE